MLRRLTLIAVPALALAACDGSTTREIRVVGSSTVFPFTTAVAEAFVNAGKGRKTPVIESTGTGAGFKEFCKGLGAAFPDIADASRRMKRSEYDQCQANGVGEIMEVQVGVDGIALAESNAGPRLSLSEKDIYLALAASPRGQPNAAKSWQDVNRTLPAIPIQVMGPPSTSGTRDAFAELILEPGCLQAWPEARALKTAGDPARFEKACRRLRDDGPYVDKGENDNLIVRGLKQNPNALGIFGYSYLEENRDRLHGVPVNGTDPTYDTIAMGEYPGSRPLYIYVKKRHLRAVPGLPEFLDLYTQLWNPGGPLSKRGLIAAPTIVRNRSYEIVRNQLALKPGELR